MKRLSAAAFALLALSGAGLTVSAGPALAAGGCAGAGYLCFYDYESAQYGNVTDSNRNWAAFGWNDRADWFKNSGTRCAVVVYSDPDYNEKVWFGVSKKYFRGEASDWLHNYTSSNQWVDCA